MLSAAGQEAAFHQIRYDSCSNALCWIEGLQQPEIAMRRVRIKAGPLLAHASSKKRFP